MSRRCPPKPSRWRLPSGDDVAQGRKKTQPETLLWLVEMRTAQLEALQMWEAQLEVWTWMAPLEPAADVDGSAGAAANMDGSAGAASAEGWRRRRYRCELTGAGGEAEVRFWPSTKHGEACANWDPQNISSISCSSRTSSPYISLSSSSCCCIHPRRSEALSAWSTLWRCRNVIIQFYWWTRDAGRADIVGENVTV
ncbi:hypothetical protein ILYODFUR_036699 [Ilyodon furcidens]|uniref:Uncharacterized protein n=1 Tax=Ilyodon furcidens TaxID=33524 RepID=A0ABV0VKK7_9TELE